jgi:hypothetical protein
MCCLTALQSTANMILHGYPQRVWQEELSYVNLCLDLLEFCGRVDSVAQHFKDTSQELYDIVIAYTQALEQEPVGKSTLSQNTSLESSDYLTKLPPGDTRLHYVSRRTSELIGHPFEKLVKARPQKASIGANTDCKFLVVSPFNKLISKNSTELLQDMKSGQFVGSEPPHGWSSTSGAVN